MHVQEALVVATKSGWVRLFFISLWVGMLIIITNLLVAFVMESCTAHARTRPAAFSLSFRCRVADGRRPHVW